MAVEQFFLSARATWDYHQHHLISPFRGVRIKYLFPPGSMKSTPISRLARGSLIFSAIRNPIPRWAGAWRRAFNETIPRTSAAAEKWAQGCKNDKASVNDEILRSGIELPEKSASFPCETAFKPTVALQLELFSNALASANSPRRFNRCTIVEAAAGFDRRPVLRNCFTCRRVSVVVSERLWPDILQHPRQT